MSLNTFCSNSIELSTLNIGSLGYSSGFITVSLNIPFIDFIVNILASASIVTWLASSFLTISFNIFISTTVLPSS
ncbi:hypothetical protein D3C76_1503100 [compost metagenome]